MTYTLACADRDTCTFTFELSGLFTLSTKVVYSCLIEMTRGWSGKNSLKPQEHPTRLAYVYNERCLQWHFKGFLSKKCDIAQTSPLRIGEVLDTYLGFV